jgi:toxin ParE1/3/4
MSSQAALVPQERCSTRCGKNIAYLVEFSRRAARDLANLYSHINAKESAGAARWFNGLEETILHLEHSPRLEVVTHEDDTLRQLIYGNKPHFYRVIYEVDDASNLVTVLQIRHGRQRAFRSIK